MNVTWDSGIYIGTGNSASTADHCRVFNNVLIHCNRGITESSTSGPDNRYANNLIYDYNFTRAANGPAGYAISVEAGTQSGNITGVDPRPGFVNYRIDGLGDYHLRSNSPLKGAGIATLGTHSPPDVKAASRISPTVAAPTADFDRVARPQSEGHDIGPYEWIPPKGPS